MKRVFFYVLLPFLVCLCACGDDSVHGGGSVRSSTGGNDKAFIDDVIKPLYVCCKDSCFTCTDFGALGKEYTEYKGDSDVTVIFKPRNLNEGDKLNGVEWDGSIFVVSGKAVRSYRSGRWTDWQGMSSDYVRTQKEDTGTDKMRMYLFRAEKRNGTWTRSFSSDGGSNLKGLTCADIPE